MRNIAVLFLLSMLGTSGVASAQGLARSVPEESRTLFYYAEGAWAVGTMHLGRPLTFRDGKVLVYPSQINDLLWAPDQTKPRNLMLVLEVTGDEKDKPFFHEGDEIFAPIRLLPDHSYWRDNLPNTRRHEVAGGRRYVFRGDQIPVVRKVLEAYFKAHDQKGKERWTGQIAAVASALDTTVPALREDAVRYLVVYPALARDVDAAALPAIASYIAGPSPAEEKGTLVDALVAAKVPGIKPILSEPATRDDATGAVALRGLENLGEVAATVRLVTLSRSKSVEMRTYAGGALGRKAATDDAALARAGEMLATDAEGRDVRAAVAEGLGTTHSDKVLAVLSDATKRGDDASRPSAMALADIGSKAASGILVGILKSDEGEPAIAAAAALGQMKDCSECVDVLRDQLHSHRDESVRKLIGVLLEVPLVHKH